LTTCLGLSLLLATAGTCSDDTDRPRREAGASDGGQRDGAVGPKLSWTKTVVDPDEAGKQASLAVAGSKVGIAYFRELADQVTVTCPPSGVSPGGPKARPAQDLMYVEDTGSGWSSPAKVAQTIGNTAGISLAIEKSSGKVFVGYLGGAVNQNECSSGDAVISSSSDGKTFSSSTVLDKGPVGDTVGYWMGVAVDSKGTPHAAFGDVRFSYYEVEGRQKASARYDAADVIFKENGAGVYNALLFDSADSPIVITYNPQQTGPAGGIQLALKKTGIWQTFQIVQGATHERPSLAMSPLGNLGVAYFEPTKKQMRYIESDPADHKKLPWKDQAVDTDASYAGEFSSLAYDSKGNPAVSYYKCGLYDPDKSTCDATKDGLRFAWRRDGSNWTVYDVDTGDTNFCGTYTSLGFLEGDKPIIAYRCVARDSTTQGFKGALKVARGAMQ
jgi:hypothetical protein